MASFDKLGRATFHHIEHRVGVRPTGREIRWLKHLERHGPQSSLYLHELTLDTHRDKDTSLRQMQKLRAGSYVHCPRQQRATENASFHPFIYDLTDRGKEFLDNEGLAEQTVTPTGHWVHRYMTACITSSIDVAARRAGVSYIPAHKIIERSGGTLGIDIGKKKLIPDQLFGLDYGGRFRFFCVEADRGTEPKTTASKRKSYRSVIENYAGFIGDKAYKDHYGLTAGMLLLCVFSSRTNEQRFLETVSDILGTRSSYIATQTIDGFHGYFRPPKLQSHLFEGDWNRATSKTFRICDE
jgi:hypothetical protein